MVTPSRSTTLWVVAALAVAIALVPALHCVGRQADADSGRAARVAAHHLTAPVGAHAVRPDHPHVDSALFKMACQSFDAMVSTARNHNPLRAMPVSIAVLAAVVVGGRLAAGLSRGPPPRQLPATRAGRTLLTDLCVIRR